MKLLISKVNRVYISEDNVNAIIARAETYQTGHPLAIKAATELVAKIKSHLGLLSSLDYQNTLKEYEAKTQELGDNIPTAELEYLCLLEGKLNRHTIVLGKKDDAVFTLVALDFFINGVTRATVDKALESDEWYFKHQVLTRFEWHIAHSELLNSEKSVNMPFLNDVGSAHNRKTIDREYHTLLNFLPLYNKSVEREFLLKRHNGNNCPDFVVADSLGELGVEITEAASSADACLEQKYRETFIDKLKGTLSDSATDITFWDYPKWKIIAENDMTIISWLDIELKKYSEQTNKTDPYYCEMKDLGLNVQLGPRTTGHIFEMGRREFDYGSAWRDVICEQVVRVISHKISKGSQPAMSPTIMVVYINEFLNSNAAALSKSIADRIGFSYKSMFENIWLFTDSQIISV
ncbi:MAG: hypothetical protein JNL74_04695 [Fibrobacteres bacterium]|nr:hypothetical protein [Fibrobacterota bacterium]